MGPCWTFSHLNKGEGGGGRKACLPSFLLSVSRGVEGRRCFTFVPWCPALSDWESCQSKVAVNFSVISEVVTKLGRQKTGIPSEIVKCPMQELSWLNFPSFPFQAYVVKSNAWFEFYFPLFQTCPTSAHPKPVENKIWTKDWTTTNIKLSTANDKSERIWKNFNHSSSFGATLYLGSDLIALFF